MGRGSYVSNRETYPALTKALQKGGVHIRPQMTTLGSVFDGTFIVLRGASNIYLQNLKNRSKYQLLTE